MPKDISHWTPREEPRYKKNRSRFVVVGGTAYRVYERAGFFHAAMNGLLGWVSINADSYESLARRIKLAKAGGQ